MDAPLDEGHRERRRVADAGGALGGDLPHVERRLHELVAGDRGDAGSGRRRRPTRSNRPLLAMITRSVVSRSTGFAGRLVRAPRARSARAALLLPDDLTAQQQTQVVLQDGGDVGGQAAVRAAAEVGDVHRDATTRLERADALAQHVAQHGEVVDVVARHVALAERRLVLLAGEVRRRGDDEGDRRVRHLRHVAGVADVDDVEFARASRACRRR